MKYEDEKLVNKLVNYSIEYHGKFYIVENVPARVNEETGEEYFAPETVERIHKTIRSNNKPKRTLKTPVFDFSD